MLQPFVITNNLFGYIDGSIPCPPSTISSETTSCEKDKEPIITVQANPEYTIWVLNDAHVTMLLLSTISESAFQHVEGTTSRDLWLALERAYAPHTSSRKYTLKTQILKIQMKPDESSSGYPTRAPEYSHALANIGEPMKQKDVVMLVLSGLRDEYNGLKSTILARPTPIRFADLHALMLDHDYMISKTFTEVTPAQAFVTATSNQKPPLSSSSQTSTEAVQLAAQLGFQLQPLSSQQPQAYYTNRPQTNCDRSQNNSTRGRGNYNNRTQGNRNKFSWASNQNTVYGTCNSAQTVTQLQSGPDRHRSPILLIPVHILQALGFLIQGQATMLLQTSPVSTTLRPTMVRIIFMLAMGLPILHIGSSRFYSPNKTFNLKHILHVPAITQNLLSVQQFFLNNNDTSTHKILHTEPSNRGLYSFNLPRVQSKVSFSAVRASQPFGHPHPQLLKFMLSKFSLHVTNNCSSLSCDSCLVGKSSKLHLLSSTIKSHHILDLVFCDVWGPTPVLSSDGHRYFLLCIDHFSRFMWFFPLQHKLDVFVTFKQFLLIIERQFNTKLKSVQTDWGGGEFRNLSSFFPLSALYIAFRVHIQVNKMVLSNVVPAC
ncbi:LOW QUALITY PROTEIN: hypothetical protein OSB04_017720 [Centaurea solstitialis]|uniref:Integrase catalytic domain-containing protein n=1 Tax=Centaurea solstitialis TaxID=347529 RepID=A0AA38TFA1_9ASTR|nr:LOW QUALITY PROTEIN: hypothetical protein OSB04_017720 [Centaurea solstitialis]